MTDLTELIKSRSAGLGEVSRRQQSGHEFDAGRSPENEAGEALAGRSENGPSPDSSSEEPFGVNTSTTPSGLEIYYQAGPKRLYRVYDPGYPEEGWVDVPSVSEVLGILEKGGLPWWGMKVGVQGLHFLLEQGKVEAGGMDWLPGGGGWVSHSPEEIIDLLTTNRLTVNHVRDQAGDRGTSVHDALESWASAGVVPVPDVYPPEERGYVQAIVNFLVDSGAEPVASEVMVASVEDRFAGRYDLNALIPTGAEVVTKTYPKHKDVRTKLEGGFWLVDAKTSKSVYDTHFLQLEGYEKGSVECGHPPTEHRGVLHLCDDGRYELVESRATYEDFRAVLEAYRALQRVKERK